MAAAAGRPAVRRARALVQLLPGGGEVLPSLCARTRTHVTHVPKHSCACRRVSHNGLPQAMAFDSAVRPRPKVPPAMACSHAYIKPVPTTGSGAQQQAHRRIHIRAGRRHVLLPGIAAQPRGASGKRFRSAHRASSLDAPAQPETRGGGSTRALVVRRHLRRSRRCEGGGTLAELRVHAPGPMCVRPEHCTRPRCTAQRSACYSTAGELPLLLHEKATHSLFPQHSTAPVFVRPHECKVPAQI
jgi:hypothetical protein